MEDVRKFTVNRQVLRSPKCKILDIRLKKLCGKAKTSC